MYGQSKLGVSLMQALPPYFGGTLLPQYPAVRAAVHYPTVWRQAIMTKQFTQALTAAALGALSFVAQAADPIKMSWRWRSRKKLT